MFPGEVNAIIKERQSHWQPRPPKFKSGMLNWFTKMYEDHFHYGAHSFP